MLKKTSRVSVTIPDSTREAIDGLAHRQGTSVSETVKQLIETGLVVEAVVYSNGEVIARNNGHEWRLASPLGRWIPSNTVVLHSGSSS